MQLMTSICGLSLSHEILVSAAAVHYYFLAAATRNALLSPYPEHGGSLENATIGGSCFHNKVRAVLNGLASCTFPSVEDQAMFCDLLSDDSGPIKWTLPDVCYIQGLRSTVSPKETHI